MFVDYQWTVHTTAQERPWGHVQCHSRLLSKTLHQVAWNYDWCRSGVCIHSLFCVTAFSDLLIGHQEEHLACKKLTDEVLALLSVSANDLHMLHWCHCRLIHHNRFTALFPGPPGWAGARIELLNFIVQGKTNRCRHTDHPAGCHSIPTKQYPPPPSPIFYRPDALPVTQPTVSKHWRQLAHLD